MDEDYYNWIHVSEQEDKMPHDFQQGDKVRLTTGSFSGREAYLEYWWPDEGLWTVYLTLDALPYSLDVDEKDMEFVE